MGWHADGSFSLVLTIPPGTWHHTTKQRFDDKAGLVYTEHVSTEPTPVVVSITRADLEALAFKAFRNKSRKARRGTSTAVVKGGAVKTTPRGGQ